MTSYHSAEIATVVFIACLIGILILVGCPKKK